MQTERSFLAAHLPHHELVAHVQRDGVAVMVTGSTECHGAHLPLGTDTFVANAVAIEVARRCDGVVFPPFWFSYSGGTRPFPGTVSIPGSVQLEHARAVLRSLIADGYRRILHIQWHAPYHVSEQLTREIFEETGVPVVFFGLMQLPVMRSMETAKLIGDDAYTRETNVAAGALSLLNLSHLLGSGKFSADQQPAYRPEESLLEEIGKAGGHVGHYYTDSTQHLPIRTGVNAEAGKELILQLAAEIAGTTESLRKYSAILAARRS